MEVQSFLAAFLPLQRLPNFQLVADQLASRFPLRLPPRSQIPRGLRTLIHWGWATFVTTDTTWLHFEHFRHSLLRHGRPMALSTDGLALFGYQSSTDRGDPRSESQRELTALGISHLVAPSPQAKGKIERWFGTFRN